MITLQLRNTRTRINYILKKINKILKNRGIKKKTYFKNPLKDFGCVKRLSQGQFSCIESLPRASKQSYTPLGDKKLN